MKKQTESIKTNFIKYKKLLQWFLVIICLVLIVRFVVNDKQEWAEVLSLKPLMLVAVAGMMLVSLGIYTWHFGIVMEKCSGRSIDFWTWFNVTVQARFLSTFVPQAGNVYRALVLKKNYGVTYTRYISGCFSFAWLDTCVNFAFAAMIILFFDRELRIGGMRSLDVVLGLLGLVVLTPVLSVWLLGKYEFSQKKLAWAHEKLAKMLGVSVRSLTDRAYVLKFLVTAVLSFAGSAITSYLCFASLDVQINLPQLAMFYIVLKLSNHIIITPGNLAVRELAYGFLCEYLQIGMAQGIMMSVIMRLMGTGTIILFGMFLGGAALLRQHKDGAS